jgi:hypothetical protein
MLLGEITELDLTAAHFQKIHKEEAQLLMQ